MGMYALKKEVSLPTLTVTTFEYVLASLIPF
jgi:hypothetical protein